MFNGLLACLLERLCMQFIGCLKPNDTEQLTTFKKLALATLELQNDGHCLKLFWSPALTVAQFFFCGDEGGFNCTG